MKKGITFGAFDLFHAGHVLMLEEAKSVCDHLTVCIQTDPSIDRKSKNSPVQSLEERQIQVLGCRYVDEVVIYDTENDLLDILDRLDWDIRILGEEYRDRDFTGRKQSLDKRFKLQKKFIEDVFPILCTCGRCTSRATLNFKKLCFSWNELAKTCTTLKIETPAGKTNWERIQVKRVCEYRPKKITPPLDEFME